MITHVNFGGERTYTTGLVRFSDTMSQARIGRRNNGEAVRGNLIILTFVTLYIDAKVTIHHFREWLMIAPHDLIVTFTNG